MNKITVDLFIILLFVFKAPVFGEEKDDSFYLSGILPSELKPMDKPYIVSADIIVPPGSSVTIDSGVVLLFENFTGLHVQGTLFIKGKKDAQVVFTSRNDRTYNPSSQVEAAPFDWNGIDVYENAVGTSFEMCKIMYSVYGIRSQTEHIRIDQSVFKFNGKADFTIRDEKEKITGEFYSYSERNSGNNLLVPDLSQTKPQSAGIRTDASKTSKGAHPVFRTTCFNLFLIGTIVGSLATGQLMKSQKRFEDLSSLDEYEKRTYTSADWDAARKKRNQNAFYTSAAFGAGLLGLTGFIISFTF